MCNSFLGQIMVIMRPQNIFTCPVHCFRLLEQLGKSSKNIIFWSNSLTIPFGVQIYPFWAFLRVENFSGQPGGRQKGFHHQTNIENVFTDIELPQEKHITCKKYVVFEIYKKCRSGHFLEGVKKRSHTFAMISLNRFFDSKLHI